MRYLFENYQKRKSQDIKNPIYEKHIAFRQTKEQEEEQKLLDKLIEKNAKHIRVNIIFITVFFAIAILTGCFFTLCLQKSGVHAFMTAEVLLFVAAVISILMLGILYFRFLKIGFDKKFKEEISPIAERMEELIKNQVDFKDSDIVLSIPFDILVHEFKCGKKRKRKSLSSNINAQFFVSNNKFYINDGTNFLEIQPSSFIGIEEIEEPMKLFFWPGDRPVGSKKYKRYKIKVKDNEIKFKNYYALRFSDSEGMFHIPIMPYEKQKAVFFFEKLQEILSGKYVPDGDEIFLPVENMLFYPGKALKYVLKEVASAKCTKVTIIGACRYEFAEEFLEKGFLVNYVIPTQAHKDRVACFFSNYEDINILHIDDICLDFNKESILASGSEYFIIMPYALENPESLFIKTAKAYIEKAGPVMILKNRFFGGGVVDKVDGALAGEFEDYESIEFRRRTFDGIIETFGDCFNVNSFEDKMSTVFLEFKEFFFSALKQQHLEESVVKNFEQILRQAFNASATNNVLDIAHNTQVFFKTKKEGQTNE